MFRRAIREDALGTTRGTALALDTSPELRRCAPLLMGMRLSSSSSYLDRRRKRLLDCHALLDAQIRSHIIHVRSLRASVQTRIFLWFRHLSS